MDATTKKPSIRLSALLTAIAALVGLAIVATSPTSAAFAAANKPTVVLVHGAFADASGWNSVIERLSRKGYATVAVANPLRGVKEDAAALEARLATIDGPIVLVGHSYGGTVLSNVRAGNSNIKSLVFIAAFAPAKGEAAAELAGMYPGSTLGDTLAPVPLPDGSNDLYIKPELFRQQFAADVPARQAALMAATQRPIRDVALGDKSGAPLWADVPSWFLLADADHNIPWKAQKFMADRADSRHTVTVKGASHAVHVSRPGKVTDIIVRAAR
jgi:pimeloyl-ACP methyl ester carboxylesterase